MCLVWSRCLTHHTQYCPISIDNFKYLLTSCLFYRGIRSCLWNRLNAQVWEVIWLLICPNHILNIQFPKRLVTLITNFSFIYNTTLHSYKNSTNLSRIHCATARSCTARRRCSNITHHFLDRLWKILTY